MVAAAPARRQEERSRSTRLRVLEAAVECLVERGWSGTTTTVVAERAGVSRGAQLHHYRTKSALVVAAVEHLAERRAAELRAEAAMLAPGGDRVAGTVDLLASLFTGPLFAAAIEVWVAARSDRALRAALVPLEARLGREMHRMTVALLGADESRPGVRESVQATLDLLRGLGVASLLTDDSARRGRLLAEWSRQLRATLGVAPGGTRPAGARPSATTATRTTPGGTTPAGPRPAGTTPTRTTPGGTTPAGPRPSGTTPTRTTPGGTTPAGSRPAGTTPTRTTPGGTTPAGPRPAGTTPTRTTPGGTTPAGSRPAGTTPTRTTAVGASAPGGAPASGGDR